LTGAKGINLWASFRTPPPQRSTRLYQALVNTGLASAVNGGLVPTQQPFLYTISATVTEGIELARVEEAAIRAIDRVRIDGITADEVAKAKNQLRARLVFENDSITNIAHQLGYFETIASWRRYSTLAHQIAAVTLEQVSVVAAKRFAASNRTIGWFAPLSSDTLTHGAGAAVAHRRAR
jgi:zinc protease